MDGDTDTSLLTLALTYFLEKKGKEKEMLLRLRSDYWLQFNKNVKKMNITFVCCVVKDEKNDLKCQLNPHRNQYSRGGNKQPNCYKTTF